MYCHDHYSKAEYYAGALPDGLGIRYDFKGEVKQSLAGAQKVVRLRGGIFFPPHYPLQTARTVQAALA